MYWITKNLGTASLKELDSLKKENIEIEEVYDLIDGKQVNKGQFDSKVKHIEEKIKKGRKVVIVCRGGYSRSNAVAVAYLVKSGMDFGKAYKLVKEKVPIVRIRMDLMAYIKENYGK